MRFPKTPPDTRPLLEQADSATVLRRATATLANGRYLHWDELRHRTPPHDWSPEQWWMGQTQARLANRRPVAAMVDAYGTAFGYVGLPQVEERLHRFDRANVSRLLGEALGSADAPAEYRIRQLIEEAISSSQIEGARPTTRELARKMVQQKRTPASKDERMILNNWKAMNRVLEFVREDRPLQISDLLELHRILGEDTLEVDGADGCFRQAHHRVEVMDMEGTVWHSPPPADGLETRIQRLLDFTEGASGPFLHPVLRAIVAHFWLAYEHPFRDGNGRMARALYYFCMLRHGYEMAEFLSISGPIDRSPRDYYLAFAYTESDGFDLTYFILHQLKVMQDAMDDLTAHLRRRAEHTKELSALVADFTELNYRQRTLLHQAIRHPKERYTIEAHAQAHGVHYHTARADLHDLTKRGLLKDSGGRPKRYSLDAKLQS